MVTVILPDDVYINENIVNVEIINIMYNIIYNIMYN